MLNLPKKYTKKSWIRGGSVPEHEKFIGMPSISWSQIEKYRNTPKESFNNRDGLIDYITQYFLNIDDDSDRLKIFGAFGTEVENYICERKDADMFDSKEKETLETIEPLGKFQVEVVIDMKDFVILGFIDDHSPIKRKKIEIIRDYKTKSENSKKDLHSPKKLQLPLYVGAFQKRGIKVGKAEYCIIERLGGGALYKGGGRPDLKVGERIWYEEYKYTQDTITEAFEIARKTATEISEYYSIYQKLNGSGK